jgi:hypothetical protein
MQTFKALICTTALLAALAMVPAADAQIGVSIGVQPVCSYGYYDYSPYACAPVGFYGPGYFYIASTAAAADGTTAAVVLRLIVLMRPIADA